MKVAIAAGAMAYSDMAVLADGVSGGATASDQVLLTAKQQFDLFKPGDDPSVERLQDLLREIVLDKLLDTLMRTALEHAGATRGLLMPALVTGF